jgi:hypothetical protein
MRSGPGRLGSHARVDARPGRVGARPAQSGSPLRPRRGDDSLPDRRCLERQATCGEACLCSQLRSVGRSLFGGGADFCRPVGVEVLAPDRCEPDIGRLPDALASSGGDGQAASRPSRKPSMSGACGRAPESAYTATPSPAPTIARPSPTHSALPVPALRPPEAPAAKWTKIGAIMNAATARRSSTMAKTRCRLAAGNEKPATKSAGATVAPSPSPVTAEPIRASGWLAGTSIRRSRRRGRTCPPMAGSAARDG